MKKQIENVFIFSIGIVLVLVGFVGVLAPIVPGLLLIILGVYLISLRSIWVKNKLGKFAEKNPYFKKFFKKDN